MPDLLDEIVKVLKRFVILPEHCDVAIALWICFTWVIDDVNVAPILAITSPEKQCGKTTLLSVIKDMVKRPLSASNITPSALFRSIETWQPTLMIDEADTFLGKNEELRGILNAGHTRSTAFVVRSVGDNHDTKRFNVWGAKLLALIGGLPETLHDRSIIIRLRRKLGHESVEKHRRANPKEFEMIRSKLARFAQDNGYLLQSAETPLFPEGLSDRAEDNWESLLMIADTAGDQWSFNAYQAAAALYGVDHQPQGAGVALLADIRELLASRKSITSNDLLKLLCEDCEKQWETYNRGKEITARQIARLLREYDIKSKTIRINHETYKGYDYLQFEDAFNRYLPVADKEITRVTQSQSAIQEGSTLGEFIYVTDTDCASITPKAAIDLNCDSVTHKKLSKQYEDDDNPF